ncbi:MAG TPA: isoamylase early set domain-containing protein [Gemmatimonadaceae bacterium]|nr:isoamylase early set domain-containing protein [Gemmatimonadaceae bacterium]
MSDEHDEMIERIAARLRPLPEVDAAARARVLVAVAAERERDRERTAGRRPRVLRWLGGATIAAGLAFGAFLVGRDRGVAPGATPEPATLGSASAQVVPPPAESATATLASRGSDGATALQPVQLVFHAPAAKRVSVVGDFTGWDATRAVMTRDSGSGLWSVSLALPAGRHVYAFLVDDSLWVRDPRAPRAPDADFGRPGSVLLVGRP